MHDAIHWQINFSCHHSLLLCGLGFKATLINIMLTINERGHIHTI